MAYHKGEPFRLTSKHRGILEGLKDESEWLTTGEIGDKLNNLATPLVQEGNEEFNEVPYDPNLGKFGDYVINDESRPHWDAAADIWKRADRYIQWGAPLLLRLKHLQDAGYVQSKEIIKTYTVEYEGPLTKEQRKRRDELSIHLGGEKRSEEARTEFFSINGKSVTSVTRRKVTVWKITSSGRLLAGA